MPWLDTDRRALEHVAIVCWLEGASPESFLFASVDSSMRGFVYQARDWEQSVLETAERNSIPTVILTANPDDLDAWLAQAREALNSLLEGRVPGRTGGLSSGPTRASRSSRMRAVAPHTSSPSNR